EKIKMMKKNITKIVIIIAVITVCIGAKVYADYVMNASEVEYTKSDSTKVSVKAALDDLYTKSQQGVNQAGNLALSQTSVGLSYLESKSITITNPNNIEIEVESSDVSIATVTKNSNTEITINSLSQNGGVVITVKAPIEDSTAYVVNKIKVGVWNGSGTMPASYAKVIVNSSNIASYQGTEVVYNPTGGGTWRIFYYDETGKYGDGEGTVYIKRDYDNSTKVESYSYGTYYTNSSNKSQVLADMRQIQSTVESRR
ncbi:MAG: hypothetical protein IJ809_07215, partial [Clostridia bacterium]|nr:hypothetical protein [Clostridia bacterium]